MRDIDQFELFKMLNLYLSYFSTAERAKKYFLILGTFFIILFIDYLP